MELAQEKLKKVTDAWNHYFLEYKFCQDRINFTEEVSSNYFGDIIAYFSDTFPLISKEPFSDSRKEHLGNEMALLQSIYVQQDLMDETMRIFKLGNSSDHHKKENRELRNRLIGHPISRNKKTKALVSSVFLRYDNPENEIIYILYEAPKYLNGQWKRESIDHIIAEHIKYLNRNFDIILKGIQKVLYEQRKHLSSMLEKAKKRSFDPSLIEETFIYFEAIKDDDYLFKKDRLEECYRRRKEHKRYMNAIKLFRATLISHLTERIADIATFGKKVKVPPPFDPTSMPTIRIKVVTDKDFEGKKRKYKRNLHYEFSKLLEKNHPLVGISYFMETFGHIPAAAEELTNMRKHKYNDTEYYASYHLLKDILKNEHSRMFYE